MEIEIIKLPVDEWEQFRDLRLRSLQEEPNAFGASYEDENVFTEEKWTELLSTRLYLFARCDSRVVGLVSASKEKALKLKHIAHIWSMYVAPEFRAKGIGKLLMEKMIDELKADSNLIKVNLFVTETQKEAEGLYEKLGFVRIAVLEKEMHVDGRYFDSHEMVKFFRKV